MRWPSLEEVAERWRLAHTLALVAWAVVAVLGLALLFRHFVSSYPATDRLKTYAGENVTFLYPANWTTGGCAPASPFMRLPGTLKANYNGQRDYGLAVVAQNASPCTQGRAQHFAVYPPTASSALCHADGVLPNGTYLELAERDGQVTAVVIRQAGCSAPRGAYLLRFYFEDPAVRQGKKGRASQPSVAKNTLLQSQQYKDITALAESIRY